MVLCSLAAPAAGLTPLLSRKVAATDALMAKFTFCGTSPLVAIMTLRALSFATTIPTRFPDSSRSGPPLLPP